MPKFALCLVTAALAPRAVEGQATFQAISIVAADILYSDVAQQLAGPNFAVASILSNSERDADLFEASPSVARNPVDGRDRCLQ
jgi:zinc/manganese transport system substrate-binding protein